jgi:hypothetical protein
MDSFSYVELNKFSFIKYLSPSSMIKMLIKLNLLDLK